MHIYYIYVSAHSNVADEKSFSKQTIKYRILNYTVKVQAINSIKLFWRNKYGQPWPHTRSSVHVFTQMYLATTYSQDDKCCTQVIASCTLNCMGMGQQDAYESSSSYSVITK